MIEGDRITAVGPAGQVKVPEGADVIDLSGATVLPGLIDAHTHIGSRADRYDEIAKFKDTPFQSAFAAVKHAKITLESGFTTIRDVGGRPFLAVDLRTSIDEGFIPGPRVVASGPGISITGGHGDLNNYPPQVRVTMFPEERDYRIADGVDQVRHVVRAQLKHGVDVIKIHASGGVLSRGDSPGAPQFTVEELRAAVEEAHAAGRKVAAHAHGAQGIKNAVTAGVDSIEHGSLIDDEGIALMVKHGTWLVADIYNDDYILGRAREFHIPEEFIEKEKKLGQTPARQFREGREGRREGRLRHRRGRLPARRKRPPVRLHGQVRIDPRPGDPLGHVRRRRIARAVEGHRPDRAGLLRRPDRRLRRPAGGRESPREGRIRDEGREGVFRTWFTVTSTPSVSAVARRSGKKDGHPAPPLLDFIPWLKMGHLRADAKSRNQHVSPTLLAVEWLRRQRNID